MPLLSEIMQEGRRVEAHRPWPRAIVSTSTWNLAGARLADGHLTLLGLWADGSAVHMALLDEAPFAIAVVTLECPDGSFPSIGAVHPPAIRLERAAHDLYGLRPEGLPDARPWLDHGCWDVQHPLGAEPNALPPAAPYTFLPVEGESLHQIPVGPVHAGIIEPGHFRFTANGETVVRLEQRLGYVHKGIEALMAGADLERGARLAGERRPIATVALFCAAARASTLARVGLLDERFEVGMFEDDDLSLALRRAGYDLAIALDAFVHHVGCASFARLTDSEYLAIWESNRRRFEAKWRVRWQPPLRL